MDTPDKPTTPVTDKPRLRWNWLRIAVSAVFVVLAVAFVVLWVRSYAVSLRESSRHVFFVESPQAALKEEDAIVFANKTLLAEGYNLNNWKLRKENIVSPDSSAGRFLVRGLDPRCGRLYFVSENSDGTQERYVELDMSGNQLTTYIWIPK